MAKISTTISDDLHELLKELAQDTGQTVSALAADFIKQGAYTETEMRNKVEIYRDKRAKRLAKGKGNGE
jgi:predicted transcriptional regulator